MNALSQSPRRLAAGVQRKPTGLSTARAVQVACLSARLPLSCAASGKTHYILCSGGTRENERNRTRQGAEQPDGTPWRARLAAAESTTAQAGARGTPPDVVVQRKPGRSFTPYAKRSPYHATLPVNLSPARRFFCPANGQPLREKNWKTWSSPCKPTAPPSARN